MHIDFRKIPGTTKLFSDFLYDFQKVEKFYAGDFRKDKNYLRLFKAIKSRNYQRGRLSSILLRQNKRFGSTREVLENIELLPKEDSVVIFTGQQAGLFGGPLYTIYKAITTLKLAKILSYRFSRQFVPIFWLDTEDHDFEEIRSAHFVDKENKIKEIKYSPRKIPDNEPIYSVEFDDSLRLCIDELNSSFHPTEFKNKIVHKLEQYYFKGETISNSFAGWLADLLGKYGLVMVDPSDKELKELAKEFFAKEIENPGVSMKLVMEAGEQLESLGYHRQVIKAKDTINLFLEAEGRRIPLRWNGGLIEAEGIKKEVTPVEFKKIIENKPEKLSPNVLLLPLLRSHLFPNAVYIGGPGEISYYAQLKSVFLFFDIPMPLVYPRSSLSLVENKIKQVLQKYSLDFTALFQEPEILINSVLKEKFPDPMEKILENKREKVREVLDDLKKELLSSELTLNTDLENTRKKIDYELKKLGEKLFQTHRQKNQILKEQIYKVKNNLFPQNKLQERVLNILPFLIKYGFEFIDLLYDKVDVEKIDHQLIEVK
ncbi:MAG: bacillithiol biosynthesis cysteine-adding enzyme BshC [candidate division Zixibacteria bacterium]|nr:bacillithiol biosynthesis cysteine-adding enzyme BshC [candidate division Zixibacteria bacterium]